MAASRGPHVRDLFIGVKKENADGESKTKSHFKKGKNSHVSLGAYKPRILSEESTDGVIPRTPSRKDDHNSHASGSEQKNRPFIIGDKDVPMTLEPAESIYSELEELLPVYGDSGVLQSTSSPTGTANPIFNDTTAVESPREHRVSVYRDDHSRSGRSLERLDGVMIPAPDYEEDELTMDFDNDTLDHFREQPLIQEFAGEDFAKYLSDDEENNDYFRPVHSMRARPPVARKALIQREKQAKTEARRNDKQKRDSSKFLFKSKTSLPKGGGKGTVRNYSVNDTKLGISMDGTFRKKEKRSLRDEVPQDSYESFLQARNGGIRDGSLESAGSDSGRESDVFHGTKSKPFWKKLTIRIKQAGHGYTLRH